MKELKFFHGWPLLLALIYILEPPTSSAQEERRPGAVAIEEVIVTARRREEDLQHTPVAVSAFSAAEMAASNIDNIAGLANVVPGLDRKEGRKVGSFYIRGVGQTRTNEVSVDPGVGVYIDGIFLPRNDSQLVDAMAVDSVQVLRGPQGTLFGKNTVGGAILVTTRDPFDEFTVALSSKLDSLGRRDGQLAIDVPLVRDRLHTKLTFGRISSDGYAEDVDSGREFGDDDRKLFIGQALIRFTDHLQLKLLGYYNDQDEAMPPFNCQFVTSEGVLTAARAPGRTDNYETACRNAEPLMRQRKVQSEDFGLRFVSEDVLLGAALSWELPFATLTSISSYTLKRNHVQDFDIDATDLLLVRNSSFLRERLAEQGLFDEDSTRWGWGQEFQLSGTLLNERLQYTAGVFAARESIDNALDGQLLTREGWVGFERIPGLPEPPPGTLYVLGNLQGGVRALDNTSYAVFGQLLYDLLPTLQLTAGLRYSFEERRGRLRRLQPAQATPPAAPLLPALPGLPITVLTEAQFNALAGQNMPIEFGETQRNKTDFTRLSPMASLAWDVAEQFSLRRFDNLMAYISVAEGFKSGGINPLVGRLGSFEPEVVLSTELGVKLDALQRRLRFNAAVYYSDYSDIQLLVTRFNALGEGETATTNAGEARIRGAEFEATWLITPRWMLVASGAYTDPEFREFDDFTLASPIDPTPQPLDRSDEPFSDVPKRSYSLSLRHTLPTERLGDFNFVLNYHYRDRVYMGGDFKAALPQFRRAATADDFGLLGARITWVPFADDSLRIALYGNNLTNERYIASGSAVYDGFGTNAVTPGKRAHGGLEVHYEFR